MSIINEFIDALAIEIDTLKKGKGGNIVTVYNGELIRQALDLFIYQFTLENFLIVLDDTPANIEVNGKEYECDIISVTGQQVQISLKQKITDRIPVAKIKTNTWYLLERLRKKYEDNLSSQARFDNSNRLFQDVNSRIDEGGFNPSYSISGQPPNPSQHKAIESSINDFISIIWGPPGTGKTATIAYAIESHLNLGRKVLLLSHSNNAVDQALTKVAVQMKSNYYSLGQLVRYGTPKADMISKIEANCPLVLMDKIAEFKSKELIKEKEDLSKRLESIKLSKQTFDKIVSLNSEFRKMNSMLENQRKEIKKEEAKIISTNDEISQIQNKINELKEKLDRAKNSGFLKRTLLGLDPVKIEISLKAQNYSFSITANQLKNIQEQLKQLTSTLKPIQLERSSKESELAKQLSKAGKSFAEVQQELNEFENKVKQIQKRLEEINKAVEEIKIQILKDSKLVATTLTKSYISKEIENIEFDILIVDEVSMAPMPMLYWAASKVKKGITIVGDFKQLPPICVSDDNLAKKWLGRSIFDELKISEISKAEKRVQLLNRQYRMHPDISEIVNKSIYDSRLENDDIVKKKIMTDDISGASALCLIDTSLHNPWCSQFETGGRFNLISALICVSLAEKISKSFTKDESIGIITPYRNQARLILKIAEDKGILNDAKIRINTVHSFQGGEETAIIFDSVEGEGSKKWSMINEFNNTESAKLLLNVALTRAKMKLYIVANCNYFKSTFERSTMFIEVLQHFISKGKQVKSTEIISDLKDENFEHWISKLNSLKNRPQNFGISYTDQEFWPAFHNDLANAEKEIIIFSPFLTSDRFSKLHLIFTELLSKGISIYVITLAPNEQPALMKGSKEVMMKLKELGVTVKFRQAMHEKIALVDRKIKWIGSLNILSHNTRKEYMERIEGESSSKELFDKFNLDELLMKNNIIGELCPDCHKKGEDNLIVLKFNHKNKKHFYGCSGYYSELKCEFTAKITTTLEDLLNDGIKQPKPLPKPPIPKPIGGNKDSTPPETKFTYWSPIKLPGYKYSDKKKAWWKKK